MMHQMVIIGNIKEILVFPFEEMYYYEFSESEFIFCVRNPFRFKNI